MTELDPAGAVRRSPPDPCADHAGPTGGRPRRRRWRDLSPPCRRPDPRSTDTLGTHDLPPLARRPGGHRGRRRLRRVARLDLQRSAASAAGHARDRWSDLGRRRGSPRQPGLTRRYAGPHGAPRRPATSRRPPSPRSSPWSPGRLALPSPVAAAGPPFPNRGRPRRLRLRRHLLAGRSPRRKRRSTPSRRGPAPRSWSIRSRSTTTSRRTRPALEPSRSWTNGASAGRASTTGWSILFDIDPSGEHGQVQLYAAPGFEATYLTNERAAGDLRGRHGAAPPRRPTSMGR